MPKKRSQRPPRTRTQPARSPTLVLAGLRGEFSAWVEQNTPSGLDAFELFRAVADGVALAAARAGLTELGGWTVPVVQALAGAVAPDDLDSLDAVSSLEVLADFLVDTGRWTGTDEALDALRELALAASPMEAALDAAFDIEVDPAVEDAAVRGTPLVRRMAALLRWLAPLRPVTRTGELRRADLGPAAELLELELEDEQPMTMDDVPLLAALWDNAIASELLEVGPRSAAPTELGRGLLADSEMARQARRDVVAGYLVDALTEPPDEDLPALLATLPTMLLAPLLLTTLTEGPRPIASLAAAAPGSVAERLAGQLGLGPGVVQAVGIDPLVELIGELQQVGILQPGDAVAVTPGLEAVVADALGEVLEFDDDVADDDDDLDPELAAALDRFAQDTDR